MQIRYKCKCMKEEREISVTDRVPGSDLMHWMERVIMMSLGYDHDSRNPLCRSRTLDFLKIPMDDPTGEVGVAPTKN